MHRCKVGVYSDHFSEQSASFITIEAALDDKMFFILHLLLLQNKHNLSDKSVLGLVCLPFSIAKVLELHRNLDIAILYFGFLTKYSTVP